MDYNCFTMLCQFLLYNKVNQLYLYIYLFFFNFLPIQVTTEHLIEFPVLYSRFSLTIYLTHSQSIAYVYICQSQFPSSSHHPSPLGIHVCSLHLYVYFCFTNRLICTIFLDSTFMQCYRLSVFLFMTYFSLYNRLQVNQHKFN